MILQKRMKKTLNLSCEMRVLIKTHENELKIIMQNKLFFKNA